MNLRKANREARAGRKCGVKGVGSRDPGLGVHAGQRAASILGAVVDASCFPRIYVVYLATLTTPRILRVLDAK